LLLAVSSQTIRSILVYDMYPWNKSADAPAPSAPAPDDPALTHAVQVALDRRDNGGDAPDAPSPARK